jgi:hypothetical protein
MKSIMRGADIRPFRKKMVAYAQVPWLFSLDIRSGTSGLCRRLSSMHAQSKVQEAKT